ncbi:MAG: hypothetical protein ABEH43_06815, partial [Flavobacteriales bacterium]
KRKKQCEFGKIGPRDVYFGNNRQGYRDKKKEIVDKKTMMEIFNRSKIYISNGVGIGVLVYWYIAPI